MSSNPCVQSGWAASYTIPTDAPEADGTFAWNSTTLVVVQLQAAGLEGLGYSYSHPSAVTLAEDLMQKAVFGHSAFEIPAIFSKLRQLQRNYGRQGVAATALSAIDVALWDLKAKLLNVPLTTLLGRMREAAPVYGSGGFTSYSDEQLRKQFEGWLHEGIPRLKMKVGSDPERDISRVRVARDAIGSGAQLFVDANGAFTPKEALQFAHRFFDIAGVIWFEEPVSSDNLDGLRLVRESGPAGMDIAAGEYGWTAMSLQKMLAARCVDVLQADATRCGGVTGFTDVAALADAHDTSLSAHCAPSLHMHLGCAARRLRHLEYFHDHVRIERMLFDGFRSAIEGAMRPDLTQPGLGLTFKTQDAEQFRNRS